MTMKMQVIPTFPGSVVGANGDTVTQANGVYTFRPDYPSLTLATGIPDQPNTYVRLYFPDGSYKRVAIGNFPQAPFVTSAVTANYSLLNADKGKVLTLGGNALFTLTVAAASGFDANFSVTIFNVDTVAGGGRAKNITINGYSSFFLWPGQQFTLSNQSSVWQFQRPPLWSPVGGLPIFRVNHASGSNASDGLGTGAAAFATIQYAVDFLLANVHTPKSNITISNAAETFTENVIISSTVGSCSGVQINGTGAVWQTNGVGLLSFDNAFVLLDGFKFVGTGSGNTGIRASKFGFVEVMNIEFGAFAAGFHVIVDPSGYYNYGSGTYVASASMAYHVFMFGGSANIASVAIGIPNPLTFTNWIYAQGGANFSTNATYSGAGAGAGSTGSKYSVNYNATAFLNGTTLPGATAGSTSNGGQAV